MFSLKRSLKSKRIFGIILLVPCLFLAPNNLAGQTLEDERRIEQDRRQMYDSAELEILRKENRLVFDYGGWANYRFDNYNDDDNDAEAEDSLDESSTWDSRFWLMATLKPPVDAGYVNEHSFYLRLKNQYIKEHPTNDEIDQGEDYDGPHVDYAYLILDFRPCWLEIGRRYFNVGQGIAYSNANDGAEFLVSLENWSLKGFASHTLPHEDNIDVSIPGWEKTSDRSFYALEATYLGIGNHGIYGYFLVQRDDSDEDPEDVVHEFSYDSEYVGLGSQGKLTPQMHYWAEVIRQTGESVVYDTMQKRDVEAWAYDLGISYDWDVYSDPNLSLEYAFGSGDSDRVSVTDTLDGNISGDDKNFHYFGYLPAGYALSPRLSNLQFAKAAVLFKPLEKYKLFKNFSLGIDYYRYFKDEKDGGIYDTEAINSDTDIGDEVDLTIFWQILSDLTLELQYGYFMPGDAYPDAFDDSEQYYSASMTLSY